MDIQSVKTFEQWSEDLTDFLNDRFEKVECDSCDGDGNVRCDCDCPHCENTETCDVCWGDGYVYKGAELIPQLNRSYWAASVIADVKKMCVFTGKDFLGEVAPLIKHFREFRIPVDVRLADQLKIH